MVEDVVKVIEAKLQQAVDVEVARVAELVSARAEREADVQCAEATEAKARQVEEEGKGQLSEADSTVPQKKRVLQDAAHEDKRLATDLEQMRARKTQLEGVLCGSFA